MRGPTTAAAIGFRTSTAAQSLPPTAHLRAGGEPSPHLGMVIAVGAAEAAGVETGVARATEIFRRHRAGQRAAAGAAAAVGLVGESPLAGRPAAAALAARGGGTRGWAERIKRMTTTTSVSLGRPCTKGTRRLAERWRGPRAPPSKELAAAGEEGWCGSDVARQSVVDVMTG